MLIDPVDRIVSILDELQLGAASLSRLLGVAQVPDDRSVSGRTPTSEKLDAEAVRFAYVEGRDVLHGVDLDVGVGERIAMVGPSGAGKSTLGRLLAGIHPPRTGAVTVGDVGLVELPLGRPPRPRRPGHAGAPRLRRVAPREPDPGATRCHRRRRARGSGGGRRPGVGRRPARGVGDGHRLRRSQRHRRAGPADRARPARPRRPAHARPGRGDLADRSSRRPPPRAVARAGARGPDSHRDRAPPVLGPRRRPGRGRARTA